MDQTQRDQAQKDQAKKDQAGKSSRQNFTEGQIHDLWDRMISSEVRALYFADLTSVLSKRKQWIAGLSFFLSSGAAATLLAGMPKFVAIGCSLIVAGMAAYVFAFNLDAKIQTWGKLHLEWNQLADEYSDLWNNTYAANARERLEALVRKEREISAIAATDAPNDQKRMKRWQLHVFRLHRLASA